MDCLGLSTAAQKCKAICLASEAATFNWCLLVRLAGGSSSSGLVVRATVRYLPTTGRYLYPKRDCCSCCSARELCSALSKKKKVQSLHTISQHNTQKHKLLSSCQFDATASAQNTVAQQAAVSETNFTAHYRRSLLSLSYCVCRDETASNSNTKKNPLLLLTLVRTSLFSNMEHYFGVLRV